MLLLTTCHVFENKSTCHIFQQKIFWKLFQSIENYQEVKNPQITNDRNTAKIDTTQQTRSENWNRFGFQNCFSLFGFLNAMYTWLILESLIITRLNVIQSSI